MNEKKIVILITTGLLVIAAVFFYTVKDEAEDYRSSISKEVVVEQTWRLPGELKEISAIAFLGEDKIACIQDEAGTVFVYNLKTSKIEKKIPFAKAGDYEGIAVHQNIIYVLRADGTIFKINNIEGKQTVETFETPFTTKNDMEGFFYDSSKDQLLMSVKERDPYSKKYKGIYAVDPRTMKLNEEAVYKMTFKEEIFKNNRKKNSKGVFFPSEVNRDPANGNLYILEAREPRLLVLDRDGKPQSLHRLDRKLFPQPEGLAFDPSGNMYISSEGKPGLIHRVTITRKN